MTQIMFRQREIITALREMEAFELFSQLITLSKDAHEGIQVSLAQYSKHNAGSRRIEDIEF